MLAAAVLIKVLIVTGTTDLPYHDWRVSTPYLRAELEKTGRFEIKVAEEPRGLNEAALAGYDVILWHYNGPRLGAAAEKAIEGFVRSGKGFVSFHGVTYGACYGQTRQPNMKYVQDAAAWPAYADLVGASWKVENIGHSARHVFEVKYTEREHPIARGVPESFTANDELYHKLDLRPGVKVIARAFSDTAKGGTGKDEPMLWTAAFGQGRIAHCPLGHDLSAMAQQGFLTALARSLEWAATGDVAAAAAPAVDKARVLVVLGGHSVPSDFFTLPEGNPRITWTYAGSQAEAFGRKLVGRFDTILFYDLGETLGEKEQANLREFVEAGGGIVSTHHAIVDYTSWPWWWQEVIGGKYFVNELPGYGKSAYREGVDFTATVVKGMQKHPVLAGVPPLPVHDEVYRNMWRSPKIQVLMETDHVENDRPVVYVGPYEKARVVYIQLGHGGSTLRHPGYRRLVHNAILWTARKSD